MNDSEKARCLRIGLVGPLPPPSGGMANQLRQLVRLLREEGIDVTVVQTNPDYRPRIIARIRGVRAVFRLLPYLFQLWRTAGRVDVMQVLANSGWSWQLFATPAVWIARLRGTPVIVNYRGGEAKQYFSRAIARVQPTMERAAAVIVPSNYLEQVFAEFGLRAEVIPNIIDLERFHPPGSGRGALDSAPHLVIARNLEPIYGIPIAIRAVAMLAGDFPGLRLSIAGSGPQEQELKALVSELRLDGTVEFTGRLQPDEIAALYREADLMINPTTVDNMPNSVLEAMASGLPIVTTNVGGIPHMLEDEVTALFVDPGDVGGMAAQVTRVLRDRELYQRLVNNGLKEVEQYAWPVVRQQWITLYERLKAARVDDRDRQTGKQEYP